MLLSTQECKNTAIELKSYYNNVVVLFTMKQQLCLWRFDDKLFSDINR